MNAAIRAVVRSSFYYGIEVVGIYRGYEGMIDGDFETWCPCWSEDVLLNWLLAELLGGLVGVESPAWEADCLAGFVPAAAPTDQVPNLGPP